METTHFQLPWQVARAVNPQRPDKIHHGMDAGLFGLAGRHQRRSPVRKALLQRAQAVHKQAHSLAHYSAAEIQSQLSAAALNVPLKSCSSDTHDVLFALLVQSSQRTLGLFPHAEQIMGALAMAQGFLLEMGTGEGKSLTAALCACFYAFQNRLCHILTVNDYLAQRDADTFHDYYAFCGLHSAAVCSEMEDEQRKLNYRAPVVYTTAKQLLADYLKDRLILDEAQNSSRQILRSLTQRQSSVDQLLVQGLDAAIIDEADSLLIDDAVSPLIISEPRENKLLNQAIAKAVELSSQLQKGRDYELEVRYRHAYLKSEGKKKIAELVLKLPAMWRGKTRSEELILQAIAAREFYKKDQQYVIQEDKVVIVDESTGRLMPERSWSHGLHQAVEIKEGLEPSDINETIIRMSFQNFFRLFSHLSGMTGTAAESVNEFWQIYQLPVLSVPRHKKNRLSIFPEKVYQTMDEKWAAIIASVQSWHSKGRPILIGTRNVKHSEELSIRLSDLGLEHQVLNAIRHADEADIIAHAGEFQRITIATNMAGRGTDIVLGDTVADIGGLHVIVCERHESARIDRQLIGRCARQGDAGSAQLFSSLDDEVIQLFTSAYLIRLVYSLSAGSSGELVKKLFNYAQKKAQSQAFVQRKQVLGMDDWLADSLTFGKQANTIKP